MGNDLKAYKPGFKPLATDVCIPISKLPETINFYEKYFKYLGMEVPILGHVGDGNLHGNIFYDPNFENLETNYGYHPDIAAERLGLHALSLGKISKMVAVRGQEAQYF